MQVRQVVLALVVGPLSVAVVVEDPVGISSQVERLLYRPKSQ